MRTLLPTALGAALLVSGCNILGGPPAETKPAAYTRPEAEAWMLITPPERLAVLELREALERLPGNGAPLPAASGEVEVDRLAVQTFYEQLQAEPTAGERASFLVEESLDRAAPVERWNQVREFKTEEHCRTTLGELQEITREASQDVRYYDGMPLYELQWVFLEWSNRWGQCVPLDRLGAAPARVRA